jgi:hypothetical protein
MAATADAVLSQARRRGVGAAGFLVALADALVDAVYDPLDRHLIEPVHPSPAASLALRTRIYAYALIVGVAAIGASNEALDLLLRDAQSPLTHRIVATIRHAHLCGAVVATRTARYAYAALAVCAAEVTRATVGSRRVGQHANAGSAVFAGRTTRGAAANAAVAAVLADGIAAVARGTEPHFRSPAFFFVAALELA